VAEEGLALDSVASMTVARPRRIFTGFLLSPSKLI
jgi:hypothetical protein